MKIPFWELAYSDISARSFGGKASVEILDLVKRLPKEAKIFDLGCGDGRNAIPLAELGFDVTAVDISSTGIGKIHALTEGKKLSIKTVVADIRKYRIQDRYDLIIAHGCLHLMRAEERNKIIAEMQEHTLPGGYNAVTVFTDSVAASGDMEDYFVGLFQEEELFDIYSKWEILLKQSYIFEDEHPGGIHHTHAVNKIVACKKESK